MQADKGKLATISFICCLEDGTLYDFTPATMLKFIVGRGHTLPSLDEGVVGMKPGEHRTIRLSAREVADFPLLSEAASPAEGIPGGSSRAPNGYEFAPGADGDTATPSQPRSRRINPPLAPETMLKFHVKMVKVGN